MTDDQLLIRHVRLCECGLPADHDSICQPSRHPLASRLDRQRDDQNTERRGERHAKRRVGFASDDRAKVAAMDDFELFCAIRSEVATMSDVAASALGRGSRSSEQQRVGPPVPQEMAADPRWRGHWRSLRDHLEAAHAIVQEYKGFGTQPVTDLTTEQRNRIVLDRGEGLSCREAAELLPEHTNGKASVVASIRRMQGTEIPSQDVLHRRVAISDGRPI